MTYFFHNTPIGRLALVETEGSLRRLWLPGAPFPEEAEEGETPLLRQAALQLDEYFLGKRRQFQLPLAPQGTAFWLQVWDALTTIPYGQTRTYGEIARQVGRPGGARAIGQANHHNPLPIFIPCHRVVAAGSGLGGYTPTPEIKVFLLELEQKNR